jgi:ribosomal protein L30E
MIAHDPAVFKRQLDEYMKKYHHVTKTIETGVEVVKNKYGKVVMTAPYLKVTLKDDIDILADLANVPYVRVTR